MATATRAVRLMLARNSLAQVSLLRSQASKIARRSQLMQSESFAQLGYVISKHQRCQANCLSGPACCIALRCVALRCVARLRPLSPATFNGHSFGSPAAACPACVLRNFLSSVNARAPAHSFAQRSNGTRLVGRLCSCSCSCSLSSSRRRVHQMAKAAACARQTYGCEHGGD